MRCVALQLRAAWIACKDETIANAFRKADFVRGTAIVEPAIEDDLVDIGNVFEEMKRLFGDEVEHITAQDYVDFDGDVATEGDFVPSATATSKPVDSEQSDSEVVEIEQPRSTFRDAYKGLAMVKSFARTDS